MENFLAELNMPQHAPLLASLGYDDPRDFADYEADDLEKLETRSVRR